MFDPAGYHFAGKLENAIVVLIPVQLAQQNRAADILQRRINSINQQLHDHRLLRPGQNQARTGSRHQIINRFVHPVFVELRCAGRELQGGEDRSQPRVFRRGRDLHRNGMRNQRNLAGRQTHSVVGHCTGQRVAVLDDIEPVHRIFRRTDATARSERPR